MKTLLFWSVLALAPAAASATGFTADDMAKSARAAPQDEQVKAARILFAETETLRAAFVINPARAFAALSASERDAVRRAMDPATERRMLALHWFMRGGIAKASIIDGAMLSGIYHPVARVWLLVRWDWSGARWRVADAALVPASTLGGVADDIGDLSASYRAATGDFARVTQDFAIATILGSRIGDRTVAQGAAFAQIDAAIATLGNWYGSAAQARALGRLEAALEQAGDNATAAALALPSQARATLSPVAAMRTAEGEMLLLSSPLAPTTLIAAEWSGSDYNRRPRLRAIPLERLMSPQLAAGGPR